MYRVRRTRQSNIDLYRQYNYIFFDLANPIAANNFINRILKSISKLEYLPYRGKKFQIQILDIFISKTI